VWSAKKAPRWCKLAKFGTPYALDPGRTGQAGAVEHTDGLPATEEPARERGEEGEGVEEADLGADARIRRQGCAPSCTSVHEAVALALGGRTGATAVAVEHTREARERRQERSMSFVQLRQGYF
jgi:hypothetical protein